MSEDRHSKADAVELIRDPDEKARREAENGIRQFKTALEIIHANILNPGTRFRLKQSVFLTIHQKALEGIHPLAGTYTNTRVFIDKSDHQPPAPLEVPDHVTDMCDYINYNWDEKNAIHLAAYVLWRMNWIHPFADGNGRTARVVSYLVLSIKLDSILPGAPTIPDQIVEDKTPYYESLESADRAWLIGKLDLSSMETMLEQMFAHQLLQATREAII